MLRRGAGDAVAQILSKNREQVLVGHLLESAESCWVEFFVTHVQQNSAAGLWFAATVLICSFLQALLVLVQRVVKAGLDFILNPKNEAVSLDHDINPLALFRWILAEDLDMAPSRAG